MHGNVFEWVNDWVASYGTIPVTDPLGPDSGSYRAARGGSWSNSASLMRAAKRFQPGHATASLREKIVGFRLALRDLNKAPTDLNSTAVLALHENQPVGSVVGEFNATDPDGHAITYHFVNGKTIIPSSRSIPTALSRPLPLLITKAMPQATPLQYRQRMN